MNPLRFFSTSPVGRLLVFISFLLFSGAAMGHVKWFVAFDISDPPRALKSLFDYAYIPTLMVLSFWGVAVAGFLDGLWYRWFGEFDWLRNRFDDVDTTSLNILRIGTGVICIVMWMMGGVIIAPELYSDAGFISWVHLLIAVAVLFRQTLFIAGLGLLTLYAYAVYVYGIFHLLDYVLMIGLGLFFIMSWPPMFPRFGKFRFPVLYFGVIFSFIWSAVEKIAFPFWFYPFLEEHSFLTMGMDRDLFIAIAAFVEFTLFFLLLVSHNGVVLLAFLINLMVVSGNLYFGKTDVIGHFPANFMLLVMMIKGPLPVNLWFFNQMPKPGLSFLKNVFVYMTVLSGVVGLYYGVHLLLYGV